MGLTADATIKLMVEHDFGLPPAEAKQFDGGSVIDCLVGKAKKPAPITGAFSWLEPRIGLPDPSETPPPVYEIDSHEFKLALNRVASSMPVMSFRADILGVCFTRPQGSEEYYLVSTDRHRLTECQIRTSTSGSPTGSHEEMIIPRSAVLAINRLLHKMKQEFGSAAVTIQRTSAGAEFAYIDLPDPGVLVCVELTQASYPKWMQIMPGKGQDFGLDITEGMISDVKTLLGEIRSEHGRIYKASSPKETPDLGLSPNSVNLRMTVSDCLEFSHDGTGCSASFQVKPLGGKIKTVSGGVQSCYLLDALDVFGPGEVMVRVQHPDPKEKVHHVKGPEMIDVILIDGGNTRCLVMPVRI